MEKETLMGERGPAPKPADQRARNESKARKEATTTVTIPVFDQPAPRHTWRPEVIEAYQSLRHVQRGASEWQQALLYGDLLEDAYATGFPAAKMANILKLAASLGLTAADRRRNGVETKAVEATGPSASVTRLRALKDAPSG